MLGSLKEDHILHLVEEAIVQVSALGEAVETDVISILRKTRQVLASPVVADRDVPLVLSAARWRVTNVEKQTVGRILQHDKVDGHIMSILARVRLICAEAIRILDAALGFSSANRCEFPRIFHRFA